MKTLVTVHINDGRQLRQFTVTYPTIEIARVALSKAMPLLRLGGIVTSEQLCFDLLIDGQPAGQNGVNKL